MPPMLNARPVAGGYVVEVAPWLSLGYKGSREDALRFAHLWWVMFGRRLADRRSAALSAGRSPALAA